MDNENEIVLEIEDSTSIYLPQVIVDEETRKSNEEVRKSNEVTRKEAEEVREETMRTFINNNKNKPFFFNNVAEMKVSNKLKDGDYVMTLGYYEENDGGGANYLIRTKTSEDVENNGSIHFIDQILVAELTVKESINAKQFGANGNCETDDTISIQNAINYCKNNDIKKLILIDGNYKITSKLTIDFSNFEMNGTNNSKIFYIGEGTSESVINIKGENLSDITIENINIDCSGQMYKGGESLDTPKITSTRPMYRGLNGIYFEYVKNIKIRNCNLNDIYGDGIHGSKSTNVLIENNTLNDCSGGNIRSGGFGYDNFGDGIVVFSSWNCLMFNNTVINKRTYQTSPTASDIGGICGRSGIEYEYRLNQDEKQTPLSELFTNNDTKGLISENNFIYGYTKGAHFENITDLDLIGNTFVHNYIGSVFSTNGSCNVTNNHYDNDGVGSALQSGYDTYSGGIALTNYAEGIGTGEIIISKNIFKGSKPGIAISKSNIIIDSNTFYNDNNAIYTVSTSNNVRISNNTFNNNTISNYQNTGWIISGNIFNNKTKRCITNSSANNALISNNIISNQIFVDGECTDMSIVNNKFYISNEHDVTNNVLVSFYKASRLLINGNVFDLTNKDVKAITISNDLQDGTILNNTIKSSKTNTENPIVFSANVNRLVVENNKLLDINDGLAMIKHVWLLKNGVFKNNYSNNEVAYTYYQSGGATNGKIIANNNSLIRFNQTPNTLTKAIGLSFNSGEILQGFSNNKGYVCTKQGLYITNQWSSGTSYTTNTYVVNNNIVYKCINDGTSSIAPSGTTIGTKNTGSDGIEWLCCGSAAILVEM